MAQLENACQDPGGDFPARVEDAGGKGLRACLHCQTCGNGCPFVSAMDFRPNGVIRLVQWGFAAEALTCSAIWICVGCHTCTGACPMNIDIPAIMDALRSLALEQNVQVAEKSVLGFHKEVLASIEKHGRTHKLGIMLAHKTHEKEFFKDINLGLRMLAKRKLDLLPSRVGNMKEVRGIFHDKGQK